MVIRLFYRVSNRLSSGVRTGIPMETYSTCYFPEWGLGPDHWQSGYIYVNQIMRICLLQCPFEVTICLSFPFQGARSHAPWRLCFNLYHNRFSYCRRSLSDLGIVRPANRDWACQTERCHTLSNKTSLQ